MYIYWPAQPTLQSAIRGNSVIGFSVLCSLSTICSLSVLRYIFLILLQLPIASIMERLEYSGCQNRCRDLPNMIQYLKVAPLPQWWQKMELKIYPYLSHLPPNISWAPNITYCILHIYIYTYTYYILHIARLYYIFVI